MFANAYPLLSVTGIELEYMLVDRTTLDILPIADKVIQALSPNREVVNELEFGNVGVSNELALHVIELKSLRPVADLWQLEQEIYFIAKKINTLLEENFHAIMLPTGAHPWFIPGEDVALWPHGDREIYNTFHRIFNCRGHGWVNLQSTHINLPFSTDEEFQQLHSAIRLLMPIIPALTASTPFIEGQLTGSLDSRLNFYGSNQQQFPLISGSIIPETINSRTEYQERILLPMYESIAPHDPEAILQYEWLNSRGAIARFDRSAIEIRIVDTQESLRQDFACASMITSALRYILTNTHHYLTQPLETEVLEQIYQNAIRSGLTGTELPESYRRQFGFLEVSTARELWEKLLENTPKSLPHAYENAISHIFSQGNLAERMVRHYRKNNSLPHLYQELAHLTHTNGCFCA